MEVRRQDMYYSSANKNNNKNNNNIKSINKNNENIIITEKEENLIKENDFFNKEIIAKIAEENRKIKYKSITNDEKIERGANKCLICEEEYGEDIRLNNYCFHSYCKECIDQSSVPSICSFSSQPFSSQPVNFT